MKHSKLGASGAHRWINCPGSVNLIGDRHDNGGDETEFSARGTVAHEIAAGCLKGVLEPWEAVGQEQQEGPHLIVVDEEDVEAIQVYVNFCQEIMARSRSHWVEVPVNLATYHVDLWGTMDFAALSQDGTILDCVDYKHGVGVVVDVEDNEQLMQYAAGVLMSLIPAGSYSPIEKVRLTIVQPRAHGEDIRTWETTPAAILSWVEGVLAPAAIATEAPDAPLVAGSWCHDHFCKARAYCPALGFLGDDLAGMVADDANLPPKEFSAERIGKLLDAYDLMKPFFEILKEEAYDRACRGSKIPGRKLIEGKSNRVWKDGAEKEAALRLRSAERYTEPKMKSPAQMEKLVGGKEFATLWAFKPPGGMVLARSDNTKKEIVRSAIDAFKGIEE